MSIGGYAELELMNSESYPDDRCDFCGNHDNNIPCPYLFDEPDDFNNEQPEIKLLKGTA